MLLLLRTHGADTIHRYKQKLCPASTCCLCAIMHLWFAANTIHLFLLTDLCAGLWDVIHTVLREVWYATRALRLIIQTNSLISYKKVKERRPIAVNGFQCHSYATSLAIWDHTVLPATRHKWIRPALAPASKLVLDYAVLCRLISYDVAKMLKCLM